jgi:ATP-dependent exoDNAse (exonuclease V) beta subunit
MHISEKNTHGHNRIEKEIKSGNAEKIPYTIGDIQLNTFNCIDDELNDIINKIKLIKQNNLPYNEIAIIVRDFNKISLITKKLNENNIPFNLSKDTLLDEKEHE